jgi:hypothetical protein
MHWIDHLRKRVRDNGYKQTAAAARVDRNTVRDWARGERYAAAAETIDAIASALGYRVVLQPKGKHSANPKRARSDTRAKR